MRSLALFVENVNIPQHSQPVLQRSTDLWHHSSLCYILYPSILAIPFFCKHTHTSPETCVSPLCLLPAKLHINAKSSNKQELLWLVPRSSSSFSSLSPTATTSSSPNPFGFSKGIVVGRKPLVSNCFANYKDIVASSLAGKIRFYI